MKVFLNLPHLHPMNEKGFLALLDYLGYERVFSKRKADIILSPSCPLNTKRYPSKIYLFGPHFSTFPNKKTKKLSNYWGNAAYILPCEIMRKIWVDEFFFQNMPCFSFPFPLVLEDYPVLQSKKKQVLVYYKMRDPEDLKKVCQFLDEQNENYKVLKYWHYKEEDYQKELDRSKFVIWLGCHESQGFALQSALAKNIPILCWSVKFMKQEWGCSRSYEKVTTQVSSAPYWDDRCGYMVYSFASFLETFPLMQKRYSLFFPREYIKENLTVEICAKNFLDIVSKVQETMSFAKENNRPSFKEAILQKISW